MQQTTSAHINQGQYQDLMFGDFVEFIDPAGAPWLDDTGRVWEDPGHALEFVGLASKVILAMQAVPTQDPSLLARRGSLYKLGRAVFPSVFENAFKMEYSSDRGGMCKAVDLFTRLPINSDIPWWNLPETKRAAVLLPRLLPKLDGRDHMHVADACLDSTVRFYVRPNLGYLPIQTRSADGECIDVIPAIPDADPLYHYGLSLIGSLQRLN